MKPSHTLNRLAFKATYIPIDLIRIFSRILIRDMRGNTRNRNWLRLPRLPKQLFIFLCLSLKAHFGLLKNGRATYNSVVSFCLEIPSQLVDIATSFKPQSCRDEFESLNGGSKMVINDVGSMTPSIRSWLFTTELGALVIPIGE